jgi:hypothetical protein
VPTATIIMSSDYRPDMESVNTSETSINFYRTTRRKIRENSHLHIRCLENLKSRPQNYFENTEVFHKMHTKADSKAN